MGPMLITLMVFGGFLVVLVLWFIATYNSFVSGRNQVKNAWSQIDVQLKRRHDLVPNLVETVKGYAGHEKSTLENVIAARNQAVSAKGIDQQIKAEQGLSGALGKLFAVAEAYPDLKANQNFLALQEELTSTENKIGFSRQFFNDSVMNYNTSLQQMPGNIVAGMFNFEEAEFFELEDKAERAVPQVKF